MLDTTSSLFHWEVLLLVIASNVAGIVNVIRRSIHKSMIQNMYILKCRKNVCYNKKLTL